MNRSTVLRALVSIVFIGILVYLMKDEAPVILENLKKADRLYLLGATFFFLLCSALMGKRLQMIFESESTPIGFLNAVNLTFVGYFYNNFLPTAVGGDIIKAMCASKITGNIVKSATAVLMDRIFGLFMFILMPSVSLFFLREKIDPRVITTVYTFLIFSLFCFLLIFHRGIARNFAALETRLTWAGLGSKMRKLYDGLHAYRDRKSIMIWAMLISVIAQAMNIFVAYMIAVALGASKDLIWYFYLLVPVVQLLSMLPSIGGLGIREGGYIYFLKPYIGAEKAAALGIIWLGYLFLNSIIGAVVYMARKDYHVSFSKKKRGVTQ